MFSQLFDLEYKRDGKEAFGFYLAYFLLLLLSSGLIGAVFASDFNSGIILGQYFAIIVVTGLSFMILFKKNQISNFGLVLIAIVAGIAAAIGGGLLGLIPTAYLTTRNIKN
jgi:hypothetical protein